MLDSFSACNMPKCTPIAKEAIVVWPWGRHPDGAHTVWHMELVGANVGKLLARPREGLWTLPLEYRIPGL